MPNLYIIAGPNGAGKTTFAHRFLRRYAPHVPFLNADEIALQLRDTRDEHNPKFAISAARLMLQEIKHRSEQLDHFAIESTLAGRTHLKLIRDLRATGYQIHLFYLWIPSPETSLARVQERVRKGGHDIPESDLRRRFPRSLRNFVQVYRSLVHYWYLFDNSQAKPRVVAFQKGNSRRILDTDLFNRIAQSGKP